MATGALAGCSESMRRVPSTLTLTLSQSWERGLARRVDGASSSTLNSYPDSISLMDQFPF